MSPDGDRILYSFDTSALIDGIERFYPPANFPALWVKVDELIGQGRLLISEEVWAEAQTLDAPLKQWCEGGRHEAVVQTDGDIAAVVGQIATDFPQWGAQGRNRADPFVIALAECAGAVVVTGEKPGGPGTPKIPYVSRQRGLTVMKFVDVIKAEGWTFG